MVRNRANFEHFTDGLTSYPNSWSDFGITGGPNSVSGPTSYNKGDEIYGEKKPAEYVYEIATGAVRQFQCLSDGRRQISAFHLPGDFFGFESGDLHRFTAEAIVDTTVHPIRRETFLEAVETDGRMLRNLIRTTTSHLQHAEDHLLLLGRKIAVERVAAFLLEKDARLTKAGVLSLLMSRRDIADYLGMTLETVSRALSQLNKIGVVGFIGKNQREIVILDRERLASFDQPD